MELSEINIYPIKSLGGISLNEANVEDRGLRYDRRWMLIDQNGGFLSQREYPKMATLKVSIESDFVKVTSVDNQSIEIPFLPISNERRAVKIWESKCQAAVYDDRLNSFFSDILHSNCQLVTMPESTRRKVNPIYAVRKFRDVVSFADGYPFLLIGQSSLDDLNSKVETPVPMNRFRPNFVVRNAPPFAEDSWKKIKIGEAIFHIVKPCARCVITTIDQNSGVSDGKEPLKTLATYRLVKKLGKSKINFGQNLIGENAGCRVKIGDELEILE